jgi:predicted nucleotidyltransferase
MTKAEAIEALLLLEPRLRELGVRSISLFGSVLRDEAPPPSDLDLIAEFERPHTAEQYCVVSR